MRDVDADGVPCRLYRPADAADGVVVHLHGGGFVFHDLDVHDAAARRLANRCRPRGAQRRLPAAARAPVPGGARRRHDGGALAGRARRRASGSSGPTYVHGDSAGGNLALVAALRHPGRFRAVALLYPFLDPTAGFDSYRTEAAGFDAARGRLVLAAVRRVPGRPAPTPTWRRCSPTGCTRCHPRWW